MGLAVSRTYTGATAVIMSNYLTTCEEKAERRRKEKQRTGAVG